MLVAPIPPTTLPMTQTDYDVPPPPLPTMQAKGVQTAPPVPSTPPHVPKPIDRVIVDRSPLNSSPFAGSPFSSSAHQSSSVRASFHDCKTSFVVYAWPVGFRGAFNVLLVEQPTAHTHDTHDDDHHVHVPSARKPHPTTSTQTTQHAHARTAQGEGSPTRSPRPPADSALQRQASGDGFRQDSVGEGLVRWGAECGEEWFKHSIVCGGCMHMLAAW